MAKKKEWRPVSEYFDLNGLVNPEYNRDVFKQFVKDFGWKEYMFSPVVRSFWKLLSGQPDYNYEDHNGLGFTRLLDRSFEKLGGHNRAFRNGQDVMMSAVFRFLGKRLKSGVRLILESVMSFVSSSMISIIKVEAFWYSL